ncbi:hypothetical protein BDD12DRAFT_173974 [Trichophaea hybrida]|nr:hypothetical protein BDD12DRAFT_173974 [Trichophaea hybrida]
MDPLSTCASGVAFVGIAGQILQATKWLIDFFSSVQDAPDYIKSVLIELDVLRTSLKEAQQVQERLETTRNLDLALYYANYSIHKMTVFVQKHEPRTRARGGGWERLYKKLAVAARAEDFREHIQSLGRAQNMLQLALNIVSSHLAIDHLIEMKMLLSHLHSTLPKSENISIGPTIQHYVGAELRDMSTSSYFVDNTQGLVNNNSRDIVCSWYEQSWTKRNVATRMTGRSWFGLFGVVRIQERTIKTYDEEENGELLNLRETLEMDVTFTPAPWLSFAAVFLRCFEFRLQGRSLSVGLQCVNVIPGDSPIWQAVDRCDLPKIRRLFALGLASPSDRDDNGYTLLHWLMEHRFGDKDIDQKDILSVCRYFVDLRLHLVLGGPLDRLWCGLSSLYEHDTLQHFLPYSEAERRRDMPRYGFSMVLPRSGFCGVSMPHKVQLEGYCGFIGPSDYRIPAEMVSILNQQPP